MNASRHDEACVKAVIRAVENSAMRAITGSLNGKKARKRKGISVTGCLSACEE